MPDVEKLKVYEEGNYGFTVFDRIITEANPKYENKEEFGGLVNVDLTFSSTRTKTSADDVADYLNRTSPLKVDGTFTFSGFTKAMYQKLYNNIAGKNGGIVFGKKQQSKAVGVKFYNTENYEGGSSENMYIFPNLVFELPNISTQTIAEDDTTIRDFSVTVSGTAQNYQYQDGETIKRDRFTCAKLNSVDDASIYQDAKDKIWLPDGAEQGSVL